MPFPQFNRYVCPGDSVRCEVDGFRVVATIESDNHSHIDDNDCHNEDQSVTGCNDEQFSRLLTARTAWFNDEWFYCGVVLSVYFGEHLIDDHAASLWRIEANYPASDGNDNPNSYLAEVANEMLDEAVESGKSQLEKIVSSYLERRKVEVG